MISKAQRQMPHGAGRFVASPGRTSVSIRLDVEQRVGAEHARQIGRGGRTQEGLVELGKARNAEQAKTADHLIFQQLQHPHNAFLARRRERPALQPPDTDEVGTGRDRLDDIGATAERAVDHDLGTSGDGIDDFRQHMQGAAAVGQSRPFWKSPPVARIRLSRT
jgi:hypothetical protein